MGKYSGEDARWRRAANGRLWMWILKRGGLHRDRERWDSHLSVGENRRMFRYFDRAKGEGWYFDRLAQEIAYCFPEYGIEDGDGLWAWLQRSQA